MLIPGDKRTMEIIREIGNSIHLSIQLEVDYPCTQENGKMPILDLKVWVQEIDGLHRIVHKFSMLRIFCLRLSCLLSLHYLGDKNGQF